VAILAKEPDYRGGLIQLFFGFPTASENFGIERLFLNLINSNPNRRQAINATKSFLETD
jgi:hypothetical protein